MREQQRRPIVEIKTSFAESVACCPVCGGEFVTSIGLTAFEMATDRPLCESCIDRHGLSLLKWFRDGARSAPLHR